MVLVQAAPVTVIAALNRDVRPTSAVPTPTAAAIDAQHRNVTPPVIATREKTAEMANVHGCSRLCTVVARQDAHKVSLVKMHKTRGERVQMSTRVALHVIVHKGKTASKANVSRSSHRSTAAPK